MENLGGWEHSEDHPDFDPNLLNVESWGVDQHQTDDVHVNVAVNDVTDQHGAVDGRNVPHSSNKHNASGDGWGDTHRHVDQWSSLGVPEFDHNEDIATPTSKHDGAINSGNDHLNKNNRNNMHLQQHPGLVGIASETVDAAVEAAVAAISQTSDSVTSGDRSGASSINNTYSNISQHLHPLGIQSSASCPVPAYASGSAFDQHHHHQQVQQQQTQEHHHLQLQQQQQQDTILGIGLRQQAVLAPASTSASIPNMANTSTATQNLSSLAANFMLAQATNPTVAAAANATVMPSVATMAPGVQDRHHLQQQHHHHHQHHHHQQQQQHQHAVSVVSQPNNILGSTVGATASRQRSGGTRQSKSNNKTKKKKSKKRTNGAGGQSSGQPPFYLFDAPIELRANFMQNQRRLGLPIEHDPNSYHYGETVNGFHPNQYQLPLGAAENSNAFAVVEMPSPRGPPNGPPPQLIDARLGNSRRNKGGQVKNEREQKRAQKITELIEQLRLQMEEGGRQVEARSKYHTLSNCAHYIKHMMKVTSDKKKENQKLTEELDEKRRKLERENEDTAMQEGRSDPESVTSTLTSDTTMSTEGGSSSEDSNNANDTNNDSSDKKHRITSSEATAEDYSLDDNRGGSGTVSGSGNSGTGSGGSGSGGISKTISSVSELTDSNRGSSSNNSGSGGGSIDYIPIEQDSREYASDDREQDKIDHPTNSSISSDAAVASGKTSRDSNTGHKDVVFNNDKRMSRKRPPEEVTSLERTFELNYEEVFHKSNIPQLIASTSGKIVTWNECFCKATGYRKSEIERMTIFSLVKPENLANFFAIVATALRPDDETTTKEKSANVGAGDSHENKVSDESSSNNSTSTISSGEDLKQSTISGSTSSRDSLSGTALDVKTDKGKTGNPEADANDDSSAKEGTEESISKRLLNYTAMTLPCVDFPAMKKRKQSSIESNSVIIPPLHVTVTLMSDKDPKRRCFHCVFTNSKGTDGALGIITPELLASLFATPLRNSRRKKNHFSSQGAVTHQRKRARGATTRVGQSVLTSMTKNGEQKHCVKNMVSTIEDQERPPSPLLMPPPGPPTESNSKLSERESEIFMSETTG